MKSFKERVFDAVKKIPSGSVASYKEVAMRAGNPKAYRAVGNILKKNFDINIPCHRVIKNNGCIGKYNRGSKEKIKLLIKEKYII